MKNDGWVRWSQWADGGMIGMGQMPRSSVGFNIREFEEEAKKLLKKTGADHVVYAIKHFDDGGDLEEVRFYQQPMDEEEFERTVAKMPGVQVYALHKMA